MKLVNNQTFQPSLHEQADPGAPADLPDPPAGQGGDLEADVNVLLYVGLGMGAVGLVITFVGIGEKGFKSLQLKLVGPGLVGCGLVLTIIRILFCTVPSCIRNRERAKEVEREAMLVAKQVEVNGLMVGGGTPNPARSDRSRHEAGPSYLQQPVGAGRYVKRPG